RRIREYASRLSDTLTRSLDIELAQVNRRGLVSVREFQRPTDALVRRLLAIAGASENARQKGLRESHANGKPAKRTKNGTLLLKDTDSPLFVRKRAQTL